MIGISVTKQELGERVQLRPYARTGQQTRMQSRLASRFLLFDVRANLSVQSALHNCSRAMLDGWTTARLRSGKKQMTDIQMARV